jgi:transketolase
MRNAFACSLIEAARADDRIVLLTGDHGYALFDEFRHACPNQFINAGVAEQNMVGVAAGLAKGGLRPIVYGLSAFVPTRVLEQIKLDICYEWLPVVFVGDGAGIVYGTLGASHQSTEDIALLRALPNLSILSPADAGEMSACMKLALGALGPVYLRMGKADRRQIHLCVPRFHWGELLPVCEGLGPIGWIATGSMVETAIAAAKHWQGSAVWSAPSIKPLSHTAVAEVCRRMQAVVVLEEHSIIGGLGSSIAEIAATYAPTWVFRVGVEDRFSATCGSYEHLMEEHGLTVEWVVKKVEAFMARMPGRKVRPDFIRPLAA